MMMLATFLLASDCAMQAMYFGRYVEVGVQDPPVWRVASSCIDADLPQSLHAVHGEQLIPIGEPGDRGMRSFGSKQKIAFQGEWRERITGFILVGEGQSPREFVRLDPVTQSESTEFESLAASVAARGGAQAWRTKQNVSIHGDMSLLGSSSDDESVPIQILAAGFDRFYMEIHERPDEAPLRIGGAGLKWYKDHFYRGERLDVDPPLRQTYRLLHPALWLGDWSALIHHLAPVAAQESAAGDSTATFSGLVQHLGPVEFTFDRSGSHFVRARWKDSDAVEFTQIRWEGLQTVEGVRFPKALILNVDEKDDDGVRIDFRSVTFDVEIKGEPFALLREGESPPPEPDPFGEEGE
ncbi:MAG: hypothetical protein CMJ30_01410 [Phycisphaerae bacterium]|jgi:hypothetical protein|nr:hypothetical protein [Phycisphaerae bacterium]